ncbi:MAG TPA: hypothetical protein H9922_08850 [Candidatus Phocaeicola caecigallinarum]|uniref:BACON domain-containing protein n=1 Tax=Bacteroidaceae TaxID=815 RepID=UPI00195B8558|nr:BACON domain-containing carbohydrate-binding protein [Bacteroides gallinaceum]MBM6659795.1 BACON domain-containing protein [Bacteroides gallinaceum]MBM6718652.1 BACON domain-containing protein [Bacteroides gallinaceum]HJD11235.1 hypothetical protein [Candidatus Phocaeicola caecigallinarum]
MTKLSNWLLILFMAFFAVSVTSCNDDEEEYSADYLLNIAEENLNISAPAEASSYEVEIVARAIWKATVTTDSGEEWITLTTGSDTGGYNTLAFDVAENTTGATRTATITITCHTAQKVITVTQSN